MLNFFKSAMTTLWANLPSSKATYEAAEVAVSKLDAALTCAESFGATQAAAEYIGVKPRTVLYGAGASLVAMGLAYRYVPRLFNFPDIPTDKALILHFDVNKTIFMADPVNNKDLNHVVLATLAESEMSEFDWNGDGRFMTYMEYVKKHLHPIPADADPFKRLGIKGQQKVAVDHFIDKAEEVSHPALTQLKEKHQQALAVFKDKKEGELEIVPSFYLLLAWLAEQKQKAPEFNYKIVLRTFGKDRDEVMAQINKSLAAHHQTMMPAKMEAGQLTIDDQIYSTPSAMHDALLSSAVHLAVQDDHSHWAQSDEAQDAGKPFPFQAETVDAISMFFDDNIEPDGGETNIVAPVETTGQRGDVPALLADGSLVKVDPIQAMLEPDYFVKRVRGYVHKIDEEIQEAFEKESALVRVLRL